MEADFDTVYCNMSMIKCGNLIFIPGERGGKKKPAWVIKLIGFLKNALVSDVQHIQVLTRRY